MKPSAKATPHPRPLRAAVYVRVSTPEQTLEGQEADLVAYCRTRGWEPVVFRDVQSGKAATRPGLEAVRERGLSLPAARDPMPFALRNSLIVSRVSVSVEYLSND